jgi:hypothetical protein
MGQTSLNFEKIGVADLIYEFDFLDNPNACRE